MSKCKGKRSRSSLVKQSLGKVTQRRLRRGNSGSEISPPTGPISHLRQNRYCEKRQLDRSSVAS